MIGTISFFVYKSMRKNSKCDYKSFYIQNNTDAEKAVYTIVGMADSVIHAMYNLDSNALIISGTISFTAPNTGYVNADKNFYNEPKNIMVFGNKIEYHSIEQIINTLYNWYMLINPYCSLSLKTLYNNPSIKYIINNFYKKTDEK